MEKSPTAWASTDDSQTAIRKVLTGLTAVLVLFSLATTVAADDVDFEIVVPISTVVRAPEGSETILNVTDTPAELIGVSCRVTARSENQSSVHPGNDLVVESDSSMIVLSDVEAESGGVVTATETLLLGGEIVITLIMGPDEVFSAGIEVSFDCPPEETTTTTEATTTTTEATTTTTEATTTTTEVAATTLAPTTSEVTTTTVPDEVLETQVLPFTGSQEGGLGLFALAIGAAGALLVVVARSREPATVTLFFSWDPACARCDRDSIFLTPHGRLCFQHTWRALDEDSKLWMPTRIDRDR